MHKLKKEHEYYKNNEITVNKKIGLQNQCIYFIFKSDFCKTFETLWWHHSC